MKDGGRSRLLVMGLAFFFPHECPKLSVKHYKLESGRTNDLLSSWTTVFVLRFDAVLKTTGGLQRPPFSLNIASPDGKFVVGQFMVFAVVPVFCLHYH